MTNIEKEIIYFIDEEDFGEGYLANSRQSAHEWLNAFLDNLEDGENGVTVKFKRKDMTKEEFEAIPEI